MTAGLVAHRHGREGADARLVGGERCVPKNVPKLVPEQPMRSAIDLGPAASQSTSGLPAAIQFSIEK